MDERYEIRVSTDWIPVESLDQLRDITWSGLSQWNKVEPSKPAEEPKPLAKAPAGRNEPCPCGSGKKYKRCCRKG